MSDAEANAHAHSTPGGRNVFEAIQTWWGNHTTTDILFLSIGLFGQCMFSMRWIAQWLAAEKHKKSVVPRSFWYFSFCGGLMVMIYGIYKIDPVIILGQFGLFIYARNLFFIMTSNQGESAPVP